MKWTVERQKMSVRIPWDKYEAAIILEQYLKVQKKDISRKKAAEHVSCVLRKMATNKGLIIDEKYRNYNGIMMQFMNLEFIMSNGSKGLSSASKIFKYIVGLYTNNIDEYNNVLDIAYSYVEGLVRDKESSVKEVLLNKFPFGIRVESPIEIMRFKSFYKELYKKDIEESDDEIKLLIKKVGFDYEGKVFIVDEKIDELLKEELDGVISRGLTVVYYEILFEKNETCLYDAKIVSSQMLKQYMVEKFNQFIYKASYMLCTSEKMTEIDSLKRDICSVWGDNKLQTYNELKLKMQYVPVEKIKFVLSSCSMFIWNSNETYTYTGSFSISEDRKKTILKIVEEKCKEDGYCNLDEINLDELKSDYYELSDNAIIGLIYEVCLSDKFVKNNKVVRFANNGLDANDRLIDYCKNKSQCSEQELFTQWKMYTGSNGKVKPLEIGYQVMIRVDENLFVSDEQLHFDVETIDGLLDNIIKQEEIGMKEIFSFSLFPHCGFSWNLYILESYCRKYSEKYKYIALNANSQNAGAIVKRNNNKSYLEVMIDAVAHAPISLNKDVILQYLVKTGYLSRCQFSEIETLKKRAQMIREGSTK